MYEKFGPLQGNYTTTRSTATAVTLFVATAKVSLVSQTFPVLHNDVLSGCLLYEL